MQLGVSKPKKDEGENGGLFEKMWTRRSAVIRSGQACRSDTNSYWRFEILADLGSEEDPWVAKAVIGVLAGDADKVGGAAE